MKKLSNTIWFFCALTMTVQSQSGLKLTDYLNNPIQYNPAYVGAASQLYVKGTHTTQWLGFDGAPVTQTLDVQKRFGNNRYAGGISLLNDDFGAMKNFNFESNFALHLNATENIGFVLGLKAGINNLSIDYNRLSIYDPTEYTFNQGNLTELKPIIGTGLYLYTKKWFIGLSTPNLLKHRLDDELYNDLYSKTPHYYSTLGYTFELSPSIELKTQLLSQVVKGAPVSNLFSVRALYKSKIGFEAHVQPKALYGGMLSAIVKSHITVTYGYDMALSDLSQYSSGNHFFGLSFNLSKRENCDCEDDAGYEDRIYIRR
ncbi:MAG: PorP/SprF family type IX secretion system membrane protein [Bacteroidetes bacterium]|nr:PorP/SprF family type IX secretion system membrane protein [Bacteroidota bacterium]